MPFTKYNQTMHKEPEIIETEARSCECGGTLAPEQMKLEEFEGGKLYVINEAPVMICQSCGEIWVPETVINEFEKMIEISQKRTAFKLKKESKKIKVKKAPKKKTKKKK